MKASNQKANKQKESSMAGSRVNFVATRVATYTILIIMTFLIFVPIFWMISTSLKTEAVMFDTPIELFPSEPTLDSYKNLWVAYPFLTYLRNSIFVVSSATFLAVVFSTFAGYGISRFKFRGRGFYMSFLLATQLFPSIMLLIPYYKAFMTYNLIDSLLGLTIIYVSFTIPFCTWMMRGYFNGISKDLDQAAAIDGANRIRVFRSVILPLAWPGIAATSIYAFIAGWNEYLFAMVFLNTTEKKTVSLGIGQLIGEYRILWNELMAAAFFALVPMVIIFIFFNRYLVDGLTAGAVKE
jgi:ABC-type glycerol-3-phosphate transport system permease component